jgi:hypothetical protein
VPPESKTCSLPSLLWRGLRRLWLAGRSAHFARAETSLTPYKVGDDRIEPEDVQFLRLDNGRLAGIYLFIPGLSEDKFALKQIGYLLPDHALGEYDEEMRQGLIKMLAPRSHTPGGRYRLAELSALFDQPVARLEGRSRQPSQ